MNISARLTRGKHYNSYGYYDIEVIANTEDQAENMCDDIINKLQDQLSYYNTSSVGCPWTRENEKNNKCVYGDSISIDYDRGSMQDTYKEVMRTWKNIKKKLGIR
ncbi:hypothetical protein [Clostridium botulinum]|uniref:hypothetical protein n=1 Tax=Clostridium botulinum TaxID=1491 RepID=UPI0004D59A49|nr:hypothetical protein [Clostridium botulinum]KEH99718.1 hypothetical protein Z952_p0042 [Clostridium botulinum C/D str. BKT75002]KEI05196.1 hypothetical protein Z954_0042 [Clostridium botulinum C/D str. BKT2873]QPW62092.1 hypothetical protein IG390_13610 [Clostridium botulinum]